MDFTFYIFLLLFMCILFVLVAAVLIGVWVRNYRDAPIKEQIYRTQLAGKEETIQVLRGALHYSYADRQQERYTTNQDRRHEREQTNQMIVYLTRQYALSMQQSQMIIAQLSRGMQLYRDEYGERWLQLPNGQEVSAHKLPPNQLQAIQDMQDYYTN